MQKITHNCTSDSGYGFWTLALLKAELKKRGAKQSGKKQDLVERLESYDRNFNFGNTNQISQPFNMDLPDIAAYRDINSDSQVPEIDEKGVQNYLELFDQDLGSKPKDMYHSRFLRTIRMAKSGQTYYFCGRVSAEMKKTVIYTVDIKIDRHNVIEESQCECGAGMGPNAHCKHVALVLYALTKAKEGIFTMETCTQVLQTFHQVKKYSGSPVLAQNFLLRTNGTLSRVSTWDPRPQHLVNMPEYPQLFRSVWINSTGKNLPVLQLYAPANILAVSHDHDYLKSTPEDRFLNDLHVTSIDMDSLSTIEERTRGQNKNKKWAYERTLRLHASNYHRICRATEKTDLAKLAQSYTEVQGRIRTAPIMHGCKYEETAIRDYEKRMSIKVAPSGIVVCKDKPFLGCSPDGVIEPDGIIEVKCPYTARSRKVSPSSVPYLYRKENGSLGLKKEHEYFYQVMGNLMCTGRKWCDFVVWTFEGFEIIRIDQDPTFINGMASQLTQFYENYFREALLAKHLYKNTHKYNFE